MIHSCNQDKFLETKPFNIQLLLLDYYSTVPD
jgi:hypothetical protein